MEIGNHTLWGQPSISSVLGHNGQPETVSEALSYCLEQMCSPAFRHMGGSQFGLGILEDVVSLMSLGGDGLVCGLCDLHRKIRAETLRREITMTDDDNRGYWRWDARKNKENYKKGRGRGRVVGEMVAVKRSEMMVVPKEDDGELTEMRTKYFSRDLLQITGMAIEIVSISM
uniref:Zinc finger HIT domain-containing protein 2 isoform X2 n=1 Tax=Tanacetum cinerariifolium TaxID=118510 RepID=A0A6L2NMW0_TANCI|nr:zinc finger HIT domain-containing protein 2 isoform X2 [Tanacetum cinerariifolium]